jgi:hypothetical protein
VNGRNEAAKILGYRRVLPFPCGSKIFPQPGRCDNAGRATRFDRRIKFFWFGPLPIGAETATRRCENPFDFVAVFGVCDRKLIGQSAAATAEKLLGFA